MQIVCVDLWSRYHGSQELLGVNAAAQASVPAALQPQVAPALPLAAIPESAAVADESGKYAVQHKRKVQLQYLHRSSTAIVNPLCVVAFKQCKIVDCN